MSNEYPSPSGKDKEEAVDYSVGQNAGASAVERRSSDSRGNDSRSNGEPSEGLGTDRAVAQASDGRPRRDEVFNGEPIEQGDGVELVARQQITRVFRRGRCPILAIYRCR